MIDVEQKVTWSYQHCNEKIVFEFDMNEMNHEEMFMMWVKFMNAVGYTLDSTEMENMWNGECKANDHLIAAGPELLEALDDIIGMAEAGRMVHVINAAKTAIAKAKGE